MLTRSSYKCNENAYEIETSRTVHARSDALQPRALVGGAAYLTVGGVVL